MKTFLIILILLVSFQAHAQEFCIFDIPLNSVVQNIDSEYEKITSTRTWYSATPFSSKTTAQIHAYIMSLGLYRGVVFCPDITSVSGNLFSGNYIRYNHSRSASAGPATYTPLAYDLFNSQVQNYFYPTTTTSTTTTTTSTTTTTIPLLTPVELRPLISESDFNFYMGQAGVCAAFVVFIIFSRGL